MRAAGNLAGVEFLAVPWNTYSDSRETWAEIITESGYFFTRSAMRFFDSRVAWDTLTKHGDGYLFITSEKPEWDSRRYTVRFWTMDNGTNPAGESCEFATLAAAKKHLTKLTTN